MRFLNRITHLLRTRRVFALGRRGVAKVFQGRRRLLNVRIALFLVDWHEFVEFLGADDVCLLGEDRCLLVFVLHHILITNSCIFEILKIGAILSLDLLHLTQLKGRVHRIAMRHQLISLVLLLLLPFLLPHFR